MSGEMLMGVELFSFDENRKLRLGHFISSNGGRRIVLGASG
jgi:hypothetical protein